MPEIDDTALFAFEDDFVASLRCIPMAVRFKLDACGVKLSLRQWSRFTQADRRALLLRPCGTGEQGEAYREALVRLVAERTAEAAKPLPPGTTVPWEQLQATPAQVRSFAGLREVRAPSDAEWRGLTPLQRFALLKLSRDNHDNVNFVPALREFGLLAPQPAEAAS